MFRKKAVYHEKTLSLILAVLLLCPLLTGCNTGGVKQTNESLTLWLLSTGGYSSDYNDRIAILGGIDLNYLITATNEQLKKRCEDILTLTKEHGRYMLGSGNSLPDYIPIEKILIMLNAGLNRQ